MLLDPNALTAPLEERQVMTQHLRGRFNAKFSHNREVRRIVTDCEAILKHDVDAQISNAIL